jgi:hypothetical protein
MKKLFFVSVLFLSLNGFSQVTIQPKSEIKSQVHKKEQGGKYYSEYVVRPEKLKTFFHSGEIPTDFPKYDKYKDFEANKLIAKEWARVNKNLIKQEYWYKFED